MCSIKPNNNQITSKLSKETKQSFKRSRSDGHSDRYHGKYRSNYSWPSKNYRHPPFNKKEGWGGGGESCSKEPELNHDQNVKVRDRELQVAGRLKHFLSVWMDITSDRKIRLDMVEHWHLEFTENPYQQYPKPPIELNSEEAAFNNCLVKRVLDETDPAYGQYVQSTIFLGKTKNGSYRLILNLKGLNASIGYQQFKMESSKAFLMKKNCYMASIDLTDAYYTVPVAVEHRKYLRFFWRNRLFQYTCLPNGLAPAPRYFTKLLKPVYSTLRSQGYLNVGYIDDSYLQGDSKTECRSNILTLPAVQ